MRTKTFIKLANVDETCIHFISISCPCQQVLTFWPLSTRPNSIELQWRLT